MSALFYATRAGGATLDKDEFGGNPFATSLIELVRKGGVTLRNLPSRLTKLTARRTRGRQAPECRIHSTPPAWRFDLDPGSRRERRLAMVLIVSDYSLAGATPLRGAAADERRIAAMLAAHGFSVMQGIAPTRQAMCAALNAFAKESRQFDTAVIYSTGHGLQLNDEVFLLPGDYRPNSAYSLGKLRRGAVPIARMTSACQAAMVNLVFFAGCRTLISRKKEN